MRSASRDRLGSETAADVVFFHSNMKFSDRKQNEALVERAVGTNSRKRSIACIEEGEESQGGQEEDRKGIAASSKPQLQFLPANLQPAPQLHRCSRLARPCVRPTERTAVMMKMKTKRTATTPRRGSAQRTTPGPRP